MEIKALYTVRLWKQTAARTYSSAFEQLLKQPAETAELASLAVGAERMPGHISRIQGPRVLPHGSGNLASTAYKPNPIPASLAPHPKPKTPKP